MSTRLKMPLFLLILCLGMFLTSHQAQAAKPIAKITSFKGEVIILSDTQVTTVTQTGLVLNEGDRLQTKQGLAEVTFLDGSVMKVSEFTSTMIQEREEESGWLFKSKSSVRRLTIFVGKLWFKSGTSQTKNMLQTPTAVCGLRGSEADVGFNNKDSFLNMISGESQTVGEWVKGVFENPGQQAAMGSEAYQALAAARDAYNKAVASGKPEDITKAKVDALNAVLAAANALANNPDPTVSTEAKKKALEVKSEIEKLLKETVKEMTREEDLTTTSSTTSSNTTTTTTTTSDTTTTTTTTTTTPATTTTSRASDHYPGSSYYREP